MWCVYRYTAKSLLVRRWSQGPHPPSSWPGQISALTLQSMGFPSLTAQRHFYCRDSGWTPPPPGPLSPLTTLLPFMYPLPMLCQAHLTFFKMSLASFPEPEHLLCCKTASKLRTLFASFPQGSWDHSLPGAGANIFFLSVRERELSCETPAVCKPEQVCVFSSK